MRPSTNTSRPAIAGDRFHTDILRIAVSRLPLAAFSHSTRAGCPAEPYKSGLLGSTPRRAISACLGSLLLLLSAGMDAGAQQPVARVTGPRESRPGALVVLDATESVGTGRLWLLAVSPEETSFLPVESGLKCIFASPTPGVYRFVLVVSGTNANGGPAADMTTHEVRLVGGTVTDPTKPPIDPPNPPPDPSRKPTRVTYVWEKDQAEIPAGVQSALQAANEDSSVVASDFECGTTDGDGDTPDQYKVALYEATKAGIPALVVEFSSGPARVVKSPKTAKEVTEAMKP